MIDDHPVAVLRALSACPTAPFHETYVAEQIRAFVDKIGLTVEADRFGTCWSGTAARMRRRPHWR